MTILVALLGAGLVFVTLRDIFQQLFRPHGEGSLSRLLMRTVWCAFCRFAARRQTLLVLAGPAVLLAIIASWVILLVTGWALIFWPHVPEGFLFATGLNPRESFIDALYLSLVTLTTLGYGDITPMSGLLRILAPLEALIGFGLLTAATCRFLSLTSASTDGVLAAYARGHLRALFGADRVSRSEQEVGERTMMVSRSLPWYLDLGGGKALPEVEAPRDWVGKSLSKLQLPRKRGLTVLLLGHKGDGRTFPGEGTILREGDAVVVWGNEEDLDEFNLLGRSLTSLRTRQREEQRRSRGKGKKQ